MKKTYLTAFLLLLSAFWGRAQFFHAGDDPGYLRWYSIETPHYQLIYPSGTDSLARVYGTLLEQFRVPMGRSIGQTPGEKQRRKMPVVLHAYYPFSNGAVGWAPRRFDLYPLPEAYGASPSPWPVQLAAHEPRHQAQFEKGSSGWFKAFNYLTGQAWNPVYWQAYLSWALGEGDAVVTETALTTGTRARTADFLNYYRVAFDQGDFRSWHRWRFGSYKRYAPNHYALGYLSLAGARVMGERPFLLHDALELSRRKPWLFAAANYRRVAKTPFRDIQDYFNAIWQAEDAARSPFMSLEQISPGEAFSTDYHFPLSAEGELYALRSGKLYPAELVVFRDGSPRHLAYLNSAESPLRYDRAGRRIYWSELRQDARWKLAGYSDIACYDLAEGKKHSLTRNARLYNPAPSEDGSQLAAVEYLPDGKQAVVVLEAQDGKEIWRAGAPEGLQPCETAWLEGALYVCGLSREGFGLYRVRREGAWEQVLAPSAQKITQLTGGKDCLEWVSDRTGVNELYRYFPDRDQLLQLSSTRYGASDFFLGADSLYCVSQTLSGKMLFKADIDALMPREVVFSDVHSYPVEDALTAQEAALGPAPDLEAAVPVSAPKRYYKLAHPLRLHSWLPLYVNVDAVKEGSMDLSYNTASVGLSGFFQNTLGTFSGMVAYSAHPDPDGGSAWRNALHLQATYSGLYPVIEARLDVGGQSARQYFLNDYYSGNLSSRSLTAFRSRTPQVSLSLRTYVPLSWRRLGVSYGFTPQLNYSLSNSLVATEPVEWTLPPHPEGLRSRYFISGIGGDRTVLLHRLSASARGYVMLGRAPAAEYPRLGVGLEMGANFRPGMEDVFTPNLYAYLYGYLPGFSRTQGLRLTGMAQQLGAQGLRIGEMAVNTLPRGFSSSAVSAVGNLFPLQWKVTADYAVPIPLGEINIPGIAYITHFVLTPHGDFTGLGEHFLWSAGADLTARLAKLILPFDSSLGVSFSYLGGDIYDVTGQQKPYSVSLIFNMDF